MRQYKIELSIIVVLLFFWEAEFFILDIRPCIKEAQAAIGITTPEYFVGDGTKDRGTISLVDVNIIDEDPGIYYLKAYFHPKDNARARFGYVWNPTTNQWVSTWERNSEQLQIRVEENGDWNGIPVKGFWSGQISVKTDIEKTGYYGPGSYTLKVRASSISSSHEIEFSKEDIPIIAELLPPQEDTSPALNYILINELLPDPEGEDREGEFIELFNNSDTTAYLDKYELQDQSGDRFLIGLGTTIPAFSYRAFYPQGKIYLNNGKEGDVVRLTKDSKILEEISYIGPAPKNQSYNRQDDNTWAWSTTTTPGTKNEITTKDTNSTDPAENKIYPRHIWINEFFPNPEGKDAENEFIEIYNPGPAEIDLTAWQIDDQENKGSHPYTFPENFIIKRGEYLALPYSQTKISLNNNGDWVRLLWPDGQAIDEVPYSDPPEGESYNKTNNGWRWSCTTTPGEPNKIAADDECATSPEEETKNYSRSIWINEFLPNPAGRDTENEFIEIYNKGPDEIDLNGWQIDDCENKGSHPHKFPAGKIIKAGEYLSLPYSDTKIALNNDHDCVRLLWPDDTAIDEIEYENPPEAESYNKKGQGWCWSTTPTPGEQNNCSGKKPEKEEIKEYSRALWINEFLPDPKGKDEEGEFIELQNRGEEEIDLTDWQIDDCENTGSRPHTFSENTKIQPDHYLTLYYKDTKISLNNNGDCVRLLNPAGQAVDEIKYGKAKEGQSYSRQNVDHWQWTDNPTPYKDNEFPQILAAKAEGPKTPKNQVQPNQQKILPPHQNLRCGGLPQTGPDMYFYYSPIFLFFFIPRTSPPKADGAGFPARLRLPALGGLAGGRSTKPRRKRCLPAKACGFRRWQAGHGCKPMELHFYLTKFKKYYKNRGCSFKSNLLEP